MAPEEVSAWLPLAPVVDLTDAGYAELSDDDLEIIDDSPEVGSE